MAASKETYAGAPAPAVVSVSNCGHTILNGEYIQDALTVLVGLTSSLTVLSCDSSRRLHRVLRQHECRMAATKTICQSTGGYFLHIWNSRPDEPGKAFVEWDSSVPKAVLQCIDGIWEAKNMGISAKSLSFMLIFFDTSLRSIRVIFEGAVLGTSTSTLPIRCLSRNVPASALLEFPLVVPCQALLCQG